MERSLKITEIYPAIQGEASFAGTPCTMIRLSECPLRCRWCDTVYSFKAGPVMSFEEITKKVEEFGINCVEFTGGEPLAQPSSVSLMHELCEKSYKVLVETSGSECIKKVPKKVHIIMDLKCPGSGMVEHNRYENLDYLKPGDDIKFVIANKLDFDWAIEAIAKYQLNHKAFNLLCSPAWGLCNPKDLSEWILSSKQNLKLNLQWHKYIWGPRAKGV